MPIISGEDIYCDCLGDIIIEKVIIEDGDAVQYNLKCRICGRVGFIFDMNFVMEDKQESQEGSE